MAVYQVHHVSRTRSTGRIAMATLLAATIGIAGFGIGRASAPDVSTMSRPTPAMSLRPGDVTEPAWVAQLHRAMNRLAEQDATP